MASKQCPVNTIEGGVMNGFVGLLYKQVRVDELMLCRVSVLVGSECGPRMRHQPHLVVYYKGRNLSLPPILWNQCLHIDKIPQGTVCTLNLEKPRGWSLTSGTVSTKGTHG